MKMKTRAAAAREKQLYLLIPIRGELASFFLHQENFLFPPLAFISHESTRKNTVSLHNSKEKTWFLVQKNNINSMNYIVLLGRLFALWQSEQITDIVETEGVYIVDGLKRCVKVDQKLGTIR